MRTITILLAILLVSTSLIAQQDPLYGLYVNNPLAINPAYTGLNNNCTIFSTFRKQWAGFDGSPATMNAGAHSTIWRNKLSAGLMIVADHVGENKNSQVTASFGYKIPVNRKGMMLSFGLQGGFVNYKSNTGELSIRDGGDSFFVPLMFTRPTIGAGMMLMSDKYLFGISVPRLISSSIELGDGALSVYEQHLYVSGTYLFQLSERLTLKPSALLKIVKGAPLSTDLNCTLLFDRNYGAGIYTRNFNTLGMLLQMAFFEKFRLSYAMELPTGRSVGPQFTTHELMLTARLRLLKEHEFSQSNF